MKILAVSNFYPPHYIGGYELGCRDVIDGLRSRGHNVRVLTSMHGVDCPKTDGHVHRFLKTKMVFPAGMRGLPGHLQQERHNQKVFRQQIREFSPDLISIWNLRYASMSIFELATASGIPTACYVSDGWFQTYRTIDTIYNLLTSSARSVSGRMARLFLKLGLRMSGCRVPVGMLKPRLLQFCSEFLRRESSANIAADVSSTVCRWGVRPEQFPTGQARWPLERFLYVGQIAPHKGVHTAIAGFLRVAEREPNLTMTIVGAAIDETYEASLKKLISESPAGSRVHFAGKLSREDVARIYSEHDLLLFPSEWDEPFSIALIEAMASGLVIVGTQTGGTGEILIEGETGFVYKAGDALDCAAAIDRALNDRTRSDQVRQRAASTVRQTLTMDAMIEQIESQLAGLVHAREVRP